MTSGLWCQLQCRWEIPHITWCNLNNGTFNWGQRDDHLQYLNTTSHLQCLMANTNALSCTKKNCYIILYTTPWTCYKVILNFQTILKLSRPFQSFQTILGHLDSIWGTLRVVQFPCTCGNEQGCHQSSTTRSKDTIEATQQQAWMIASATTTYDSFKKVVRLWQTDVFKWIWFMLSKQQLKRGRQPVTEAFNHLKSISVHLWASKATQQPLKRSSPVLSCQTAFEVGRVSIQFVTYISNHNHTSWANVSVFWIELETPIKMWNWKTS